MGIINLSSICLVHRICINISEMMKLVGIDFDQLMHNDVLFDNKISIFKLKFCLMITKPADCSFLKNNVFSAPIKTSPNDLSTWGWDLGRSEVVCCCYSRP